MKTIVAPTDFSAVSLNAVNYAANMAKAMNASLSLLHVCLVPMAFSEIPYPPENFAEIEKEAEKRIQQLKKILEQRTKKRLEIHTAVRVGPVLPELIDYCQSISPYAVVMATRGSTALERILFGGNTLRAMKHLSWPLIVVPPEARFTGIKKIALACDLKDVAASSPVKEIGSLLKEFGAKLFVLHVANQAEPVYAVEKIEEAGLLHDMLEELHPSYQFFSNANIEEGLNEFAKSNKIDLLVVIPKKLNPIEQLFHKSHSKRIALDAHVPVMAVHEK